MKRIITLLAVFVMAVTTAFASPDLDYLCFEAVEGETQVSFTAYGTLSTLPSLQYSSTGSSWTDYVLGDNITLANAGDKVYFKAKITNETFSTSTLNYVMFKASNKVAASGNIMYLLDPEGKQTSVPRYAFAFLFHNCANLTSAPELPATTLGVDCYLNMFYRCYGLTEAPALPATTLASECYYGMFDYCTSLKYAPELPATTLVDECYSYMFNGCTSLQGVSVKFTNWKSGCTTDWLKDVASTGSFVCPEALDLTTRNASRFPSGWTNDYLCFTAENAGTNLGFNVYGSSWTPTATLQYSTDGYTWQDYTFQHFITLANAGDKVYFKATSTNDTFSKGEDQYILFNTSDRVAASGNIMSLLDETCQQTSVPECAFLGLFYNIANLTTAPKLPATTLGFCCYADMFEGCTSLTTAPELPAKTLADGCYSNMFNECSSLTTAPELPATTLAKYCYGYMFYKCASLTSAPALPATTLTDYCYEDMFCGCTSLTSAPALPATTLAKYCYEAMFSDCTSLTTAPALPATTLADYCYFDMFHTCTSLTTAPALPATTLAEKCYYRMFTGCTNLNSVTVNFTDWSTDIESTDMWLLNVAATGTFKCSANLAQTTGTDYIPEGWTVETMGSPMVVLNSKGYATYSSGKAVKVKTTDVTLCTATVADNVITLNPFTTQPLFVPAGAGVILYGAPNTIVEFEGIELNPKFTVSNDLKPTTLAGGSLATYEDAWALGDGDQFLQYTGTSFIANRAYIPASVHAFPTDGSEAKMTMVFADDTPTGIETAQSSEFTVHSSAAYNALGQRVSNNAKGFVIKNGKKYFNK